MTQTIERTCRECGTDMSGVEPQQARICSDECRAARDNRRREKQSRRRPAYIAARLFTCRECGSIRFQAARGSRKTCPDCLTAPPMVYIRNCRGCGDMFASTRKGQVNCRKHCDRKTTLTCEWCGEEFIGTRPRGDRSGKAYCSQECLGADRQVHLEPVPWRTCPTCDHIYIRQGRSKCPTCNPQPLGPFQSIHAHERTTRVFGSGECAKCGDQFTAVTYNPQQMPRYCSVQCGRRSRNSGGGFNDRARHVTRKTGATYRPLDRQRILETDDYVCHLCGLTTDPDAPVSSDRYPSVDHVIPLSKGGDHTYDNVRCACFRCNAAKRDRISDNGGGLEPACRAKSYTARPAEKKAYGPGGSD